MSKSHTRQPIDYLMIGHITRDETNQGPQLGGTASYSALTAKAMGLKPGVVTSWAEDLPLGQLAHLPIHNLKSDKSTTFRNIETEMGRIQHLYAFAEKITIQDIPDEWKRAKILHIGPVMDEVEIEIVEKFGTGFIGLTPQGWMRRKNPDGLIEKIAWLPDDSILRKIGAIVVSKDDLVSSADWIEEVCSKVSVLAVTDGAAGVMVYWNSDVRRFRPPERAILSWDTTGAGDIFAAGFFIRLYSTRDPWEAARFATRLSAYSVTRIGLEGVPTIEEIHHSMIEVVS